MDPLQVKQYEVDDLPGLLLSPRSSKNKSGKYVAYSHCYSSLSKHNSQNENLPKHAITYSLAIGYTPEILDIQMLDGGWVKETTVKKDKRGDIIDNFLTRVLCASITPVRPHAYILSYNGGRHQSIRGNHQLFEANHTKVAGALKNIKSLIASSNI